MIAYLRQQKGESCIVEPKLNQVKVKDLRLYNPWPELQVYVDCFDLAALPEMEHCHVPFAIILIKAL
jgi:amyloid beta precursor protein binding protein 1